MCGYDSMSSRWVAGEVRVRLGFDAHQNVCNTILCHE